MTYIGLDVGDKRVGVALEIEGISIPFSIIERHKIVLELKKIVKEKKITGIAVGLPYDLYGKKLKQLEKTQKFIDKLRDIFPEMEVVGIDERFTTYAADEVQKEFGKTKNKKDDIAAAFILDTYLQSKK